MTKPLTCVAALVCYEMGYYELDDPVSRCDYRSQPMVDDTKPAVADSVTVAVAVAVAVSCVPI